jgi:predicted nucleic-acid-binding Zn-ribbon protein
MNRMDKCVKCGSDVIVHRAMVVSCYGNTGGMETNVSLRVDGNPNAIFRSKETARSIFHAEVCSDCGYVEFYADSPAELLQAFVEAQGRDGKR